MFVESGEVKARPRASCARWCAAAAAIAGVSRSLAIRLSRGFFGYRPGTLETDQTGTGPRRALHRRALHPTSRLCAGARLPTNTNAPVRGPGRWHCDGWMAGTDAAGWRWQARMVGRSIWRPRRMSNRATHVPRRRPRPERFNPLNSLSPRRCARRHAAPRRSRDCEPHARAPRFCTSYPDQVLTPPGARA